MPSWSSHSATAPRRQEFDPVDDRHHRAAAEAGRHLADDRVDPAAFDRQCRFSGDDRDVAAARRVAAQFPGAVEAALAPLPAAGQAANASPVSEAKNERTIFSPLSAETK